MSFLSRIFTNQIQEDRVHLGRYSHYHLSDKQLSAWEKAMDQYTSGDFFEAFTSILEFLKLDGQQPNVHIEKTGEQELEFIIYHGSVRIKGTCNNNGIYASSRLAKANKIEEKLLLRLLHKNYDLEFAKYALNKENEILLVLNYTLSDAQPDHIVNGFREMALQGDKLDDLIANDNDQIDILETAHTMAVDSNIKSVQIDFLKTQIDQLIEHLKLEKQIYQDLEYARVYKIFQLAYAIDFLLTPQGSIMESLEAMHIELHNKADERLDYKVEFFINELTKIRNREAKSLSKELYQVFYTFNLTPKVTKHTIKEIIDNERQQLNWYIEQGHKEIAESIISYIFGYSLFNYTVPAPFKMLINIYYKCEFADYFKKLEQPSFVNPNGTPEAKTIKNYIKQIRNSALWKEARINYSKRIKLDYDSKLSLGLSLIDLIYELDFDEYEN